MTTIAQLLDHYNISFDTTISEADKTCLDGVLHEISSSGSKSGTIEDRLAAAGKAVVVAERNAQAARDTRDYMIMRAKKEGMTQQAIADCVPGITRGRIAQILLDFL